MSTKQPAKQPRLRGGSDSIRAKGYRPLVVGLPPELHQSLRVAAAERGVSMAHYVRHLIADGVRQKT